MKRSEHGGGPDGCECGACTRIRLNFHTGKTRAQLGEDRKKKDKALDELFLLQRKDSVSGANTMKKDRLEILGGGIPNRVW